MIDTPTILPEGAVGEVSIHPALTLWQVTTFHRDEVQADPVRPTGEERTFYVVHRNKWHAQWLVRQRLQDDGIYVGFPKVKKVPLTLRRLANVV